VTRASTRYCDLVMKGGITSGVVYPNAVLALAREFRFKNIGGTSARAIAAAISAAAALGAISFTWMRPGSNTSSTAGGANASSRRMHARLLGISSGDATDAGASGWRQTSPHPRFDRDFHGSADA
jgi:Patatin-like phospholipase